MSAVQILASQPWVERLGWTLIHFLWQGFGIAVLYAAIRQGVARRSTASARYLLACGALAAMMAAPLVTWALLAPPVPGPESLLRIPSAPAIALPPRVATAASLPTSVPAIEPAQFLLWIVAAWLAGALAFGVRLAGGWVVTARMRSVAVRSAPPEWQDVLRRLGAQIGLSRPVRLLVSALVEAPTVIGWLRPVVLVPVGALTGLPAAQLEALLLHELAHIRRHDYLVNVLQSIAEALLFYQPAVWWVSGHLRAERELCCDDVAVAVSGDALGYARALAHLEFCRPAHLRAAVAANGGSLAHRISRLLGQSRPAVRTNPRPGSIAVAVLLAVAAYALFGQSSAPPAFQSASIRRNTSDENERFRHAMGMGVNSSLLLMIQFAYAPHESPYQGHSLPLPASQVVGGPEWINSERYDIDVKPAAGADPRQQWLMWRSLLADRFKLKLHRETRDLPIYVLTASADGLKLPAPPKDLGCVAFPPGTKPHPVPGKVDCGYVSGPFSGSDSGRLSIQGSKVHIADLTRELALILDRPMVDKTGFAGEFDLHLSYAANGAPDIFAAMEQQLGLHLAPAKGPVEVLVIDHAERP